MAKISVIVPVYKVEPYLRRCVDSILAQTYRDFELILVDDGSPDNCGKICDEYAKQDSRVVVIHQSNGGLSAARNAGIVWMERNSSSEWVSFVDSDDTLYSDYFECLIGDAEYGSSKVAVCGYCRVETLDDTSGFPQDEERVVPDIMSPEQFWQLGWELVNVAWCKLYSRSVFDGVRYPVGRINEDAFVTYKVLFSQHTITYRADPHYNHLVRADSIMGEGWSPRRFDDIDAIDGQVDYFKEHGYLSAWRHVSLGHIHQVGRMSRSLLCSKGVHQKYWKVYQKRLIENLAGRCKGCGFKMSDSYDVCRVVYPNSFWIVWPFVRGNDFFARRGLIGAIRYLWGKWK